MSEPLFTGLLTALVTPFKDGALDEAALTALVERQIRMSVEGLVPAGVFGECDALTPAEHRRVLELCVQATDGRVPVLAGAACGSLPQVLDLIAYAASIRACGALVSIPHSQRPDEAGLYDYFAGLSEAAALPLVIELAPTRTGIDLSIATVGALSKLPKIAGVVDAHGDVARVSLMRRVCPPDFALLCGEDAVMLGYLAQGGHGCVSLTANVAPKSVSTFMVACQEGEWAFARDAHDRLIGLHQALAADAPAAAKFGLHRMAQQCEPDTRAPNPPYPEAGRPALLEAMSQAADVMYHVH